jgi:hypothetical protein
VVEGPRGGWLLLALVGLHGIDEAFGTRGKRCDLRSFGGLVSAVLRELGLKARGS